MDEQEKIQADAQLEKWNVEIERRSAEIVSADRPVHFSALQQIDELKLLHATARACLAALTAATTDERTALEEEFQLAWDELKAAVEAALPRPARAHDDERPDGEDGDIPE